MTTTDPTPNAPTVPAYTLAEVHKLHDPHVGYIWDCLYCAEYWRAAILREQANENPPHLSMS